MTAAAPAEMQDAAEAGSESIEVVTPPICVLLSALRIRVWVCELGRSMLDEILEVALGCVRRPKPLSRRAWRMMGNISLNMAIIGFTLGSSVGVK